MPAARLIERARYTRGGKENPPLVFPASYAENGGGYIWQLFSMTKFEERDGGVYVELEALALHLVCGRDRLSDRLRRQTAVPLQRPQLVEGEPVAERDLARAGRPVAAGAIELEPTQES